jgi:hypothetical protein
MLMRTNQIAPSLFCFFFLLLWDVVVIWQAEGSKKLGLIDSCIQVHTLLVSAVKQSKSQICQFRQGSDKSSFHLNGIILLLGILSWGKGRSQVIFFSPLSFNKKL